MPTKLAPVSRKSDRVGTLSENRQSEWEDGTMLDDPEGCYRALQSSDSRFDGWFFVAVTSTGVYCRPSCPSVTPKRSNVRFYPTAAAAQQAGYRACMRCRPDAVPGSPEWNRRADLAGRAMRLIADGVVDREGVSGLARRLAFSERHVHRQLVAELGAGALALARAQRAQTARLLIETTDLPFIEVAFAAGFSSLRQFNETVRATFALTPTELRRRVRRRVRPLSAPGTLSLRLPHRPPLDARALIGFLGARAVPGVEEVANGSFRRTLRLPLGAGLVALTPDDGHVRCVLRLEDLRDLAAAVQRCRRLLDLDADPVAVDAALAGDPLLAPLVRAAPGRRVPGAVDGGELAARAILGQQVSVPAARTTAGRLTAALGQPLAEPDGGLTHLFPDPEALAGADPSAILGPAARGGTLQELTRMLATGELAIDPGADREEVRRRLGGIRGIGPWTTEYIAMRALADGDALPATDLGLRRALERLGRSSDAVEVVRLARRWRPWRAYALQHLWATLPANAAGSARRPAPAARSRAA
jgi:AraC family transcriptional regulator, regulatory protein of adaptative response / DNA-3-methyladenine glycosylase II